ncbi:MAG: hypothetical protein ACI35O_13055 [Bacillaceae bacterium]
MKARAENFSLLLLQVLIGLGAVPAGFILMVDPSGQSLGLDIAYLDSLLFTNYFLPGLALFLFMGIGNLVCAYFTFQDSEYCGMASIILGVLLIMYMFVQIEAIGFQSFLQVVLIGVGVLESVLGKLIMHPVQPENHQKIYF